MVLETPPDLTTTQSHLHRKLPHALLWCFRIVVALPCFGVAGRYVLSSIESESDVYGFLFFDRGFPETLAQGIDDAGAYGCLISGVILIANGIWLTIQSGRKPNQQLMKTSNALDSIALIFVASWTIILAIAHSVRGEVFAELALGELAVRFVTPIAMLFYLRGFERSSRRMTTVATWLLIAATATTFGVHGYKALKLFGPFTDLILLSDNRVFQFELEQATAESILTMIGWADIAIAALLILTRWRLVAAYMLIWGIITAASRMTAFGSMAWAETLIRSTNWGSPLILLLIFQWNMRNPSFYDNKRSTTDPEIQTD